MFNDRQTLPNVSTRYYRAAHEEPIELCHQRSDVVKTRINKTKTKTKTLWPKTKTLVQDSS